MIHRREREAGRSREMMMTPEIPGQGVADRILMTIQEMAERRREAANRIAGM